jgi:hypothetical protein
LKGVGEMIEKRSKCCSTIISRARHSRLPITLSAKCQPPRTHFHQMIMHGVNHIGCFGVGLRNKRLANRRRRNRCVHRRRCGNSCEEISMSIFLFESSDCIG